MNNTIIDNTYAEAFPAKLSEILITAETKELALIAAQTATGYATSFIGCPAEAGIDQFIPENETPDNRPGYSIIICQTTTKKLENQLLERIGQCILTAPTTAVYNLLPESETQTNTGFKLKFFADGYETKETINNRTMFKIPIMSGDFIIEENIGIIDAIAGGNLFIEANTQKQALKGAQNAINAIKKVPGAITPFPGGIVASGSKIGSQKYSFMNATTNHQFCPTLKDTINDSKLGKDINGIYEIVINAKDMETIKKATKEAILNASKVEGVQIISAGNYGGKLGKYHIHLEELFE
ncbi:MAG: formylmethanofuran--tetrahydromethanopterin N-formyltransferase [Methanobacteriaceae archaeon]|nr:formylmethanofuran--tetrahydromethanopterin N-formyltransferase [Methanobacteriaceae archaeon]